MATIRKIKMSSVRTNKENNNVFLNNLTLQQGTEYFEIRLLEPYYYGGYFTSDNDGLNALKHELERIGLLNQKVTIYQSLNHVKSNIIPNDDVNKLFKCSEAGYHAARDTDIEKYRWIFIDVDPDHEAKTQIPDDDLHYAEEARDKILDELRSNGFSEPMVVFSGNGQHIYLRIDEPNTPEVKKTIISFVMILSRKFSTGKLTIDHKVLNASRITKFIGSWSTKGDNTPETPYRQCKLIQEGDGQVNDMKLILDYIERNKSYLPKPKKQEASSHKKSYSPSSYGDNDKNEQKSSMYVMLYNIKAYLDKIGLDYSEERDRTAYYYRFSVCPFRKDYSCSGCALKQTEGYHISIDCYNEECKEIVDIFKLLKRYPCGKIPPIKTFKPDETIFNTLVLNGRLMRSAKGHFFYNLRENTFPLGSDDFQMLISRMYHTINKKIPSANASMNITRALTSYCHHDCFYENASVGHRMILKDNILYYALGDNRYVIIGAYGCTISSEIPSDVYFVKANVVNQVEPDLSTQPEELPDLLLQICNIDKEQISLLIANLLSFFRSDINSPILVLKGSRGSCKSSCARIIKSIVNPEKSDLISFPEKEDDLTASLSNNDLCAFDNVDRIPESMSSKLCMAVTNGYTVRRKLYSDNTEMAICISSNVILTCITDVVSQSDLAERSNVINLERVIKYRTESQINKQVSELMPKILGAVFNTLSVVFDTADSVRLDNPPRMADFAQFAMAAVKAVGLNEKEFLRLYTNHVTEAVGACAVDDPLISCISSLLDSTEDGVLELSADELLDKITKKASTMYIAFDRHYTPSTLSRTLKAKMADLIAIGIDFSTGKKGSKRILKLQRIKPQGNDIIQNNSESDEDMSTTIEDDILFD